MENTRHIRFPDCAAAGINAKVQTSLLRAGEWLILEPGVAILDPQNNSVPKIRVIITGCTQTTGEFISDAQLRLCGFTRAEFEINHPIANKQTKITIFDFAVVDK